MGATEPPAPSSFLPQRLLLSQLPRHTHTRKFRRRSCGKGDPLLVWPMEEHAEEGPAGGQRAQGGRMWWGGEGLEVVGAQLCSPALRSGRFSSLGLKDRQMDGPCSPFSFASQAPQGLSASDILGSCRKCGHRLQILGQGGHPHTSIMYRDTVTQTHTSTHKHAPMPINTHAHTRTIPQAASDSWRHWVSIYWGLRERVDHPSPRNCWLSARPGPGLAGRGRAVPGAPRKAG